MTKPVLALCAALLALLIPPTAALAQSTTKPYVVLDKSLARLRADFNANAGTVRPLYIVGPTCGICLRGLSDLEDTVYAKKKDDPRLVTFVVHVPTLGAHERHVAPAGKLISNAYTTNYWEETGIIGRLMQRAMGTEIYLWDFWTIYGPQAVWEDQQQMPVPDFWQHQLPRLPAERMLNATAFAKQVDALLDRVAASPATGQAPANPGPGGAPDRG